MLKTANLIQFWNYLLLSPWPYILSHISLPSPHNLIVMNVTMVIVMMVMVMILLEYFDISAPNSFCKTSSCCILAHLSVWKIHEFAFAAFEPEGMILMSLKVKWKKLMLILHVRNFQANFFILKCLLFSVSGLCSWDPSTPPPTHPPIHPPTYPPPHPHLSHPTLPQFM